MLNDRRSMALVMGLILLGGSVAVAAGPDVYSVPLRKYLEGPWCSLDKQDLLKTYTRALASELEVCRDKVEWRLATCKPLLENFREQHEAFKEFVEAYSTLADECQWWNLDTFKYEVGTAYGTVRMKTAATLYWKQIRCYQRFLRSGNPGEPALLGEGPMSGSDPDPDQVGGPLPKR